VKALNNGNVDVNMKESRFLTDMLTNSKKKSSGTAGHKQATSVKIEHDMD